jgi:diaminopimelate epimerase
MKFTKMHGIGNDFMVIDAITQAIDLDSKLIRKLANRHTGVGFDQCLIVEPTTRQEVDFNYRIYNADGSEVGQCGNGARCLARFIHAKKLSDKNPLKVATHTSILSLLINQDNSVSVSLGKPCFEPSAIPLLENEELYSYHFDTKLGGFEGHAINVGNPHVVIMVDDVMAYDVDTVGRLLTAHPKLPHQANIGFMQILSDNKIKLRVYERGVGETNACGSGAVAAAVCAHRYHKLDSTINVELLGGILTISWHHNQENVVLTGPASFVYEGELCTSSY